MPGSPRRNMTSRMRKSKQRKIVSSSSGVFWKKGLGPISFSCIYLCMHMYYRNTKPNQLIVSVALRGESIVFKLDDHTGYYMRMGAECVPLHLAYSLAGISAGAEFSSRFPFCSGGGVWEGAAGVTDSGKPRSWTSSAISISARHESGSRVRGSASSCVNSRSSVCCMRWAKEHCGPVGGRLITKYVQEQSPPTWSKNEVSA